MEKSSIATRAALKPLLCLAVSLFPGWGFAHQYSTAIAERRYAEVEADTTKKLKEDPRNADALMGKSELILALSQIERLDESLDLASKCVEWHPDSSGCYETLGNAAAAKLAVGGFTGAYTYGKKTREAYLKALEKDPRNFRVRISLIKFYLQAPGIIGGSNDKARAMASETAGLDKDVGSLAAALCDLHDGNDARAEAAVLAANLSDADQVQASQREILFALGQKYLAKKQFGEAVRIFSEIQKRSPKSELGPYGLGLTAQDQGKNDEALRYFEDALALTPKSYIYYSIGYNAVVKKDKPRAIKAFQTAVDFKPALSKKMRADALAQLDELKK